MTHPGRGEAVLQGVAGTPLGVVDWRGRGREWGGVRVRGKVRKNERGGECKGERGITSLGGWVGVFMG